MFTLSKLGCFILFFVVPGIIGCLEALEAIKIVANIGSILKNQTSHLERFRIVVFVAHYFSIFLTIYKSVSGCMFVVSTRHSQVDSCQ